MSICGGQGEASPFKRKSLAERRDRPMLDNKKAKAEKNNGSKILELRLSEF